MTWKRYRYWFLRTYGTQQYGNYGCGGPVIMYGLLLLWAVFMLCSCRTVYVPVREVHTEVEHKTDSFMQRDSIYLHDSVFIHSRHDTVFFEKWHTRYRDKIVEVVRVDSFVRCDSIPVPYPVERQLTRWQRLKQDWGGGAILLTLIVFTLVVVKLVKRFRRRPA